jgi:hypothetical protein
MPAKETVGERFIGDPIRPVPGTGDAAMMARGLPGLPRKFTWRGQGVEVAEVIGTRRTLGSCRHGSGEKYVRRHWFMIRTTNGATMTLYCDRQARRGQSAKARWWLFTTDET